MATQAIANAPFKVGGKQLYMPNFTITFLRTPSLSASYAKFIVPLWFSKLDLRDYLYHAYNVRIHNVRSYVKQQRVTQGRPDAIRPTPQRWHRPRAHKHMTVELERPFVWPEEPRDLSAWNQEEVKMSEEEQERMGEAYGPTGDLVVNEERRVAMREQARALLEGRERWKAGGKSGAGRLVTR